MRCIALYYFRLCCIKNIIGGMSTTANVQSNQSNETQILTHHFNMDLVWRTVYFPLIYYLFPSKLDLALTPSFRCFVYEELVMPTAACPCDDFTTDSEQCLNFALREIDNGLVESKLHPQLKSILKYVRVCV